MFSIQTYSFRGSFSADRRIKSYKPGGTTKIELVVSPDILEEYRRVGEILAEDHQVIDFKPVLEFVIQNAIVYSAPSLPERVCEDPDDDKFLACALASRSKVIVSGDKHLLNVSGYQKIDVLKPRDYVNKYLE